MNHPSTGSNTFKPPNPSSLFAFTLALGLVFTPDALNAWGNSLGNLGLWALPALAAGFAVQQVTLLGFRRLNSGAFVRGGDIRAFRTLWGRSAGDLILFCGKVPLAIGASTGLLVSAGFIFNEVFVYWFPNFAFAYLLLGAILLANLIGRKAVGRCQTVALAVIAAGLALLILQPLFGGISLVEEPAVRISMNPAYGALGIVALMGFDLALYGRPWNSASPGLPWRTVAWAVALGGVMLALWGVVALQVVPASRLAHGTISHIIIARTLLGQTGRLIMGLVVIGAAFAAVNALLFGVSRMLARMLCADETLSREAQTRRFRRVSRGAMVILAGAIALTMAGGWAGEPVLETFIRTGVILWLLHYIGVNLSALRLIYGLSSPNPENNLGGSVAHSAALAALTLGIAGLILLEAEPRSMGSMLLGIPFIAGALFGLRILIEKIGSKLKRHDPLDDLHNPKQT
ncbi:MAG: hypothetical protein WBG37_08055 [Desulfobacterales bacterium]